MYAYILVGLGGALGSMLRYGLGVLIGRGWRTSFPLGTMVVNILGSLAMGLFIGFLVRNLPSWQSDARLFVAVGLFGGFTTFSSFSLDTISLVERGDVAQALVYVAVSLVAGFAALYAGLMLTRGGIV